MNQTIPDLPDTRPETWKDRAARRLIFALIVVVMIVGACSGCSTPQKQTFIPGIDKGSGISVRMDVIDDAVANTPAEAVVKKQTKATRKDADDLQQTAWNAQGELVIERNWRISEQQDFAAFKESRWVKVGYAVRNVLAVIAGLLMLAGAWVVARFVFAQGWIGTVVGFFLRRKA